MFLNLFETISNNYLQSEGINSAQNTKAKLSKTIPVKMSQIEEDPTEKSGLLQSNRTRKGSVHS